MAGDDLEKAAPKETVSRSNAKSDQPAKFSMEDAKDENKNTETLSKSINATVVPGVTTSTNAYQEDYNFTVGESSTTIEAKKKG